MIYRDLLNTPIHLRTKYNFIYASLIMSEEFSVFNLSSILWVDGDIKEAILGNFLIHYQWL